MDSQTRLKLIKKVGKKFNSISDLDAWLDLKYRYVPRVEPNTNLVDF